MPKRRWILLCEIYLSPYNLYPDLVWRLLDMPRSFDHLIVWCDFIKFQEKALIYIVLDTHTSKWFIFIIHSRTHIYCGCFRKSRFLQGSLSSVVSRSTMSVDTFFQSSEVPRLWQDCVALALKTLVWRVHGTLELTWSNMYDWLSVVKAQSSAAQSCYRKNPDVFSASMTNLCPLYVNKF